MTLMMTVEMVVGADDSGNYNGVDGGVSKDDNADDHGDLGRDGWKGELSNDPHSPQRLHVPSSLTLVTFT